MKKMKKFPNIPFSLNKDNLGDKELLGYLKNNLDKFSYLKKETKKIIKELGETSKDTAPKTFHGELRKLWPTILTDALFCLKKKDRREWNAKNKNMWTFFDENSLGTTELEDVLEGFFDFEGMMYGAAPDRYRDHILHSFRVWIIGHALLKEHLGGVLKACDGKGLKISQEEWECMWAIVGLCHDIGYPLSTIKKVNQKARETLEKQGLNLEGDLRFIFSQQMLPFHDTIIKLMSSKPVEKAVNGKYLTHLQNKYYLKFLKSFDRLDHGIISALLMSGSLVYFLESDLSHDDWKDLSKEDARQFLIRREILRAISTHTCQDIYHLNLNTLSFLLYITDEIQCWGRPTFEQLQRKTEVSEEFYVQVDNFKKDEIDVTIMIPENTDQEKTVKPQITKLRKMLRLAVDASWLEKVSLRYTIKNEKGEGYYLELKNGKIEDGKNIAATKISSRR